MFKAILLPLFLLLCLVQWLIPGRMIWKKEKVLAEGKLYKFRTAPIDPVDPFRGRYIILHFSADQFFLRGKTDISNGSTVFATFQNDAAGFAHIQSLTLKKPNDAHYLETTVDYVENYSDTSVISIAYPFSQFYMEESKAPQAESLYGSRSIDSSQKAYALVSILEGDAVIKNVFINDSTITDIILNSRK